jgi:hypothetical protein
MWLSALAKDEGRIGSGEEIWQGPGQGATQGGHGRGRAKQEAGQSLPRILRDLGDPTSDHKSLSAYLQSVSSIEIMVSPFK